jgi:glycosyltransferase involved in cell wall biosynthesis
MMKTLICRIPSQAISGYGKIINKTIPILKKNFNLVLLSLDGNINQENYLFKYGKLTKENFKAPEIIISSLILDRYSSLVNILPDKDNISFYSMWESTILPRFPVEELNTFANRIYVPSKWTEEVFNLSGVKNVEHLSLFVDDSIFNFKPKINLDKFTFAAGSCSSASTGNSKRKNLDLILTAFRKAFKGVKDVELKFKISDCDKSKLCNILDDRINFDYNYLTDDKMSDFLSQSDVFVTSSKAEGWGFFQIESLAVGRPVITPNFGGIKDFCNTENSFFVDYSEELASGGWGKSGGCWAEVKEESLIEKMRYCYENKDLIRHNWQKYSDSVSNKFSLKKYEENIVNKLSLL